MDSILQEAAQKAEEESLNEKDNADGDPDWSELSLAEN